MACAARLVLVCAGCGVELPPQARFCFNCATPVPGAELPESKEPQPDRLVERFRRLVPGEYAERLLATKGQVSPERRTVTLLFSDVKGSTAMAEHLDPEEVLEIMDGAFDLLIEPVYRHEGTLARLMGDAVLAFFGAPLAHEDDPERAVRAALEITAGAREYAERLAAERGIEGFDVRAGIHTGLVVVGEVGTDLRVEYTAMGDAINLAARMEQNAPPGGVLITRDTYRHVRGVFDVLAQPLLAVKGRAEPVQTYLVQRAKPRAFRKPLRGVEGVETRMVGREAELKHLQEAFHAVVEDGELQVVTVTGQAGVGKSRLLYEFDIWSELLPEPFYYFKGRAGAEMQNQPYGLLRDLISFRFEILDSDTPAAVRGKLEAGVAQALGAGDQARRSAHYIGHLLGFALGRIAHLAGAVDDPERFRDQALAALAGYFRGLAGQAPVLILLEDLHWADDSSLDALNHLAQGLGNEPLMVVCAARPALFERRPHWGEGQPFHARLGLEPLSRWDSRRLVAEILQKAGEVPVALRDLLVGGAEGNPFFLEELVRMLVEDGVIVTGEERWGLAPERLAEVRVPPTLTGVLQARVDRLPPEERAVLQQASVVGRLFWDRAVARIQAAASGEEVEAAEVADRLAALRGREMIYQRETSAFAGAQEYIFQHALLREISYESVLKRLRRAYHGLVADWLLEEAGERAGEYVALIADHLVLAGRSEEAVEYLLQAGDRARGLHAHQEAIRAYERALDSLREAGDHKQAARTLMKLGLTYETAFDFRRARQAYQEGFALWQQTEAVAPAEPPLPAPHALRLAWPELGNLRLDPTRAPDRSSFDTIHILFSGLVEQTVDMAIVPDVAHSWQVSDGGRRYTFHLRGDVFWSDGVPVTAHDFVYALRRRLDPASGSVMASSLYDVAGARACHQGQGDWDDVGVRVVDDRTLVVELEGPIGYVLQLVAGGFLNPVPQHAVEAWGDAWTASAHLVTNGPFRLARQGVGEPTVLERNPRYHGRFEGNVDRIEMIHLGPGPTSAALELYEGDGLDVVRSGALLPAERGRARQRHAGERIAVPGGPTFFLAFHPCLSPFDDLRVRRAFAMAVDRERLVRKLADDRLVWHDGGFVPPGMPGHSPGIGLPYDPVQAQHLLADAGYEGGTAFPSVAILTFIDSIPFVVTLAALWGEALGVRVDWEITDMASFVERMKWELPHMYVSGWSPDYPDPDTYLRGALHWLQGLWHNDPYQDLVERARRGADQAERMALYRLADRMLMEEAIFVPLATYRHEVFVKPWVSRFPTSPFRQLFPKDVVIEPH